jgi:hypothetical protein
MGKISRRWINEHREELKDKYDDKIVLVCEGKVTKVLDGSVDAIEINEIARKICKDKDWSYTYVCREEEYLI